MEPTEGFIALELILTYAIDKPIETKGQNSIRKEIGLSEEVFLNELYVDRPVVNKVVKYLDESPQTVFVHGFPGTGKTTVVHKAIQELKTKKDICLIKFDFKGKDNQINNNNFRKLHQWHEQALETKIKKYIFSEEITNQEIISLFFNNENEDQEMSAKFENIRMDLYHSYRSGSTSEYFDEWFEKNLRERNPVIINCFDKLVSELRVRDYLYFLANQKDRKRLCILFYDNLDSVISNETRNLFYRIIRSFCGTVSGSARIILTARTSSIVSEDTPDYGAYYWHKVRIDYKEFINQNAYREKINALIKKKGRIFDHDKLEIEHELERHAKKEFAKAIIKKRTDFIEAAINSKKIILESSEDYNEIKQIYSMIIESSNIHNALLELSNHNRHLMFKLICEFIYYMVYDLGFVSKNLGDNFEEISYAYESYFYHWCIDHNKLMLASGIDLVSDTNNWYDIEETIGCSLPFLIISTIYNFTNRIRGNHSYSNSITISNLIMLLSQIGYTKKEILNQTYSMFKQGSSYVGMLETSRYFNLNNPSDFDMTDKVWLTPRAGFLAEYLSYKFLFMIALLRKNKIKNLYGNMFDYDDKKPITLRTIGSDLLYLCKMAYMHTLGLISIKKRLSPIYQAGWFQYYKKCFCINTEWSDQDYRTGDLQLNNILRSHILFLKRQSTYAGYEFIDDKIRNQFIILRDSYGDIIKKILDGEKFDLDKYYYKKQINFKYFSESEQ